MKSMTYETPKIEKEGIMKYVKPEMEVVEWDENVITDNITSSPDDTNGGIPELGDGDEV